MPWVTLLSSCVAAQHVGMRMLILVLFSCVSRGGEHEDVLHASRLRFMQVGESGGADGDRGVRGVDIVVDPCEVPCLAALHVKADILVVHR